MTTRLRVLEATYWVAAVALLLTAGLAVLAFIFGDGWLTLKYLLFVLGFLIFGVGSWTLWASTRKRPTIWPSVEAGPDPDDELWFEPRLWELPGLRGEWLPPRERVGRPIKIFLTGIAVLAISYVMETVFDVAV
jgi:hypothetical protein